MPRYSLHDHGSSSDIQNELYNIGMLDRIIQYWENLMEHVNSMDDCIFSVSLQAESAKSGTSRFE